LVQPVPANTTPTVMRTASGAAQVNRRATARDQS
jgi:hypothetical protein